MNCIREWRGDTMGEPGCVVRPRGPEQVQDLVRFCGAYHGWWEDVQPGPGNPLPPRETYTLKGPEYIPQPE